VIRSTHFCLLITLTLFATVPATALEMDYVTYNGFSQIVTAFRYVALFFSNDDYGGLVFIAAVVGFVAAAVIASSKGYREEGTFRNWFLMFGIGVGLYASFITPKGTIHVYDRTLNAYEPVAGVPDGIIILAGLTNLVEQVAVEIANTSSPVSYENTAGGIAFQLVRNTYRSGQPLEDEYLWENIKNYYLECGQVAAALPGTGFNLNAINRTSTDLLATFANAASNAVEFPYKSEADPVGTLITCTDGFTNLQSELTDPATYTSLVASLCASVGFDTTDGGQAAQCNSILDEIVPTVFGQIGDRLTYLRSASLALAMQDAAADQNPERSIAQEANRSFTTQSLGLFSFAQEYGQSVRAGFLAATMATLPLTMLFLVTPLRWRALSLSVGFFVFVAAWGIIDIGLQVMIVGVANDAFEEVRRNNLAFNAFMLTPPASVKALAVFGASRLISISLASVAVVSVFRLSGASFGQLTGSFARQGEQIGSEAADSRLNPARLADNTANRAQAAGALTGLGASGSSGFKGLTQQATGRFLQNQSHLRAFAGAGAASGVSPLDQYRAAGAVSGGGEAGSVLGLGRQTGLSESELAGGAADTAATGSERGFLDAQTFETSANELASHAGIDTSAAKELIAGYGNSLAAGRAGGTGGDLGRVFSTSEQGETQRIGAAEGIREAAEQAGLTPEQISKAGGYLDTFTGAGGFDFQNKATGADLEDLRLGGELRHERSTGEVEGVREASAYTGKSEQSLSGQAAALDASDRLIGNNRFADFAKSHGISTSDIQNARGANIQTVINDRTKEAFGRYLTPEQQDIAHSGGSFAFTFDPLTNEVGQFDVRSGNSGSQDDSVHVSDGFRFDFRQGAEGGQSLFIAASAAEDGLYEGVTHVSRAIEKSQNEGTEDILSDSFAQQASHHLSSIAGKNVTYMSSDSDSRSAESYIGYSTKLGGEVPFFKVWSGFAEHGSRATGSSVDTESAQEVSGFDYWGDRVRTAWDKTIGNQDLDLDNFERTKLYLHEVDGLRDEAFGTKDWVKEQAAEKEINKGPSEPVEEEELPKVPQGYYSSKWNGYRRH